MTRNLRKWGLLALAFGWPILLAKALPQAYLPEVAVVAVLNGLILGIWAFR